MPRSAMSTIGLFSEPSYLSLGDPYDPPRETHGRHQGLNMVTSTLKKGTVPQHVCFDKKYKRLSEGDRYIDRGGGANRARKAAAEKCLTSNGFVFSHPGKRRTGLGDCNGNFSKFPEWQPGWHDFKIRTKHDIPPAPKSNILCSTTKKGSYGVPGTTLSKGTEYTYMPDPYDRARELELEDRKAGRALTDSFTGVKNFSAMSHARDVFDKAVYTDPEHLRGGHTDTGPARDMALEGKPGFIPSSPGKKLTAFSGTFSKFPRSIPMSEFPDKKRPATAENVPEVKVFVPSNPSCSTPTTSIMFKKRDGSTY